MVRTDDSPPPFIAKSPTNGRSPPSAAENVTHENSFEKRREEAETIEGLEAESSTPRGWGYIRESWWEAWTAYVRYKFPEHEVSDFGPHPGPIEIAPADASDAVKVDERTLSQLRLLYPPEISPSPNWPPTPYSRKPMTTRDETSAPPQVKNLCLFFTKKLNATTKLVPKIQKKELPSTMSIGDVFSRVIAPDSSLSRLRYYLYDPIKETEYNTRETRTLEECGIEENQLLCLFPRQDSAYRRAGKIGLMNIGNTCYMNSSLQCLMHTPELMRYFLHDQYRSDIAEDNPDGCKGKFAAEFYALMRSLWTGDVDLINPYNFWNVLSQYYALFAEKDQHDTAELAETVLDGLMEDCNLATFPKPYYPEIEENENISDSEIAEKCWEYHKGRSESYITDVFHGQYRILTRCPSCDFNSRKFDSFTVLHVGLPPPKRRLIVFTFVEVCGNTLPEKYAIELPSHLTVKDLYIKAAELVECEAVEPWTQLCFVLDRKRRLTFLQLQDSLEHIKDHQTVLLYSYKDCDYGPRSGRRKICFVHQKRTTFSSYSNSFSSYSFPSRFDEKREIGTPVVLWLSEEEESILSKKRALQGNLDILECTLRPIKRQNHTHAPPPIPEKPQTTLASENQSKMDCDLSDVESTQAQPSTPLSSSPQSDPMDLLNDNDVAVENESIQVAGHFIDLYSPQEEQNDMNDVMDQGGINGEIQIGPLPVKETEEPGETDYCIGNLFDDNQDNSTDTCHYHTAFAASSSSSPVNTFGSGSAHLSCALSDSYSLTEAKNSPRADEAKTYVVDWDIGADQHYNLHSLEHISSDKSAERVEERRRQMLETVSIYDCLKHEFSPHPRALDGDNLWKCGSCEKMVNGVKSMRLWKAPNILLIGLKRFDYCEERDRLIKLKQMVEFPTNGLNLREFCATSLEGGDPKYDLYGVCYHLGEGLKVGHYTSCVKLTNGRWYKFNDSWVNEISESQVVSQDAYLLYYRKTSIPSPSEAEILETFRELEHQQWLEQATKLHKNQLAEQTHATTSSDETFNERGQAATYRRRGEPFGNLSRGNQNGENGSSSSNDMNNENDVTGASSQGQSSSSSFHANSNTYLPSIRTSSNLPASRGSIRRKTVMITSADGRMTILQSESVTPEQMWPDHNSEEALENWNRQKPSTSMTSCDAMVPPVDDHDDTGLYDVTPSGWGQDDSVGEDNWEADEQTPTTGEESTQTPMPSDFDGPSTDGEHLSSEKPQSSVRKFPSWLNEVVDGEDLPTKERDAVFHLDVFHSLVCESGENQDKQ